MLTLTEAAKEVGLSRPSVFNAIKKGRLSATKNDRGQFLIDPAELFRVYKPANNTNIKDNKVNVNSVSFEQTEIVNETVFLRREIELLKQQLERERDQITREREQTDHWRRQATMLLTNQSEPEQQPQPKQQEGSLLWRKLFGRH